MVRRSFLGEKWIPTPDAAPAPSPSPPPSKEFDWRWWMPMGILIVILVSPFFYWGWRLWNKKNKKPIPVTKNDRTLDKSGINIALKRVCHPSALTMFDEIISASQGKQILMFLDYDGTLSPIVEDPDRAFMSIEMREAVSDASEYFPTAIVSGRSRTKVYDFVRLAQLYYAGSHGMDIQGPAQGSQRVMCQPAIEFLPLIDEIYNTLVEKTKTTPGAFVENNKFCITVHFRRVDEKNWSYLEEQVKTVLNNYPNLRTSKGRKVLEIRPTIKWDKGNAVEFLLKSLGYENSKNVYPIYIGDDRTDEDAFKVLRKRKQGLGILVSNIPKETDASYSLQDPPEVMHFLRRLVEWKRERERKGKFSWCSS